MLLLAAQVSCQAFKGGFIKHLETGTLTAIVDEGTVLKESGVYSTPFFRDAIFDASDKDAFIATSNFGFIQH